MLFDAFIEMNYIDENDDTGDYADRIFILIDCQTKIHRAKNNIDGKKDGKIHSFESDVIVTLSLDANACYFTLLRIYS